MQEKISERLTTLLKAHPPLEEGKMSTTGEDAYLSALDELAELGVGLPRSVVAGKSGVLIRCHLNRPYIEFDLFIKSHAPEDLVPKVMKIRNAEEVFKK